ncbi:glycoside hydrolase family 78 protein [uncultured Proteiniphilum sp.]|uniref:glycoside hydrolase family 78 protein n=1 Tax=uncultured Proteiniphilum sp. TaxID=497637 RepID=UPI00261FB625|nr:glycoside hydrolase family 78 protein [uncultured Proteiniphilum sp.]
MALSECLSITLHKLQKPGITILLSVFMICTHNACGITRSDRLKIVKTTCGYQHNPLLVATATPHFAWQIQLGKKNQATLQSAYTIEIYTRVNGEEVKVWNSGKVQSIQSQRVEYNGTEALLAEKEYLWRVRIWDSNDTPSPWSELNSFRISPADLNTEAKWIGAIDKKDANIPEGRIYHGLAISSKEGKRWQQTHPLSKRSIYLRKDFSIDKKIEDAIIYVSGLGHYQLTLNGEKLGDAQFDPMWSDYDKTIYYNAYNVTDQLENNNAIGVLLGNGFFNQQGGRYVKMQVSFGPPTLLFKMAITYEDGTYEEIFSDESWKYSPSPLVFNDMYGGEDYDARLEQEGWDRYGFDDSAWQPVVVQTAPNGQLKPQTTASVKIMETYPAQSARKVGDAYVFDMGQNLSGYPLIKIRGKAGDKIRLTVGENIHEDGSVNQSQSGSPYYYEYILKGGTEEVWHPRFTYYGYRYIQIEGAKPEKGAGLQPGNSNNDEESRLISHPDDPRDIPLLTAIQSCFVYNSTPQTGRFHCSNEIFNNAYQLIINAIKSNMHAVFTDCPHREKLGWLEQVHLNGPGLFYNFDLTTFAPKIMQDIRDAQQPNGLVPDIAPEYVVFEGGFRDSPEWGSTAVILPFMYYQFYGDNSLITKYYDVMKRYVDYLSSTATDHIVSHGLGDWCDYREDKPYGVSHNTPVPLSASAHYYMVVDYLAQAAKIVGNPEDHARYTALREKVKAAFNRKFFDEQTNRYGSGSQASNAMPLFAGIVEPRHKQAVLDNLIKDIKEKGYRLSTGDVGNRYLFQTLADNGLNEIMYKMHNHREVPGYGFQLQFGATTLTELWDPRAGASWNHFMMGQIVEWFYKSLAGITTDDHSGFRNIVIAPKPVGDLKFVEASYDTLYGTISVNWRINGDQFKMDLSVPHNCTAKVYLPQKNSYQTVGSGHHSFTTTLTMN